MATWTDILLIAGWVAAGFGAVVVILVARAVFDKNYYENLLKNNREATESVYADKEAVTGKDALSLPAGENE